MTATQARNHWADLGETGILWGMRVLLWIYRRFGRWTFRLFLYPVISYYFLTGRRARTASRQYLQRVGQHFPELRLEGGWRESYRHFLAFGENLLDKIVVWLDRLDPDQVEFHNRPLLVDLLQRGQGAILLGGHIGNLEICRALADLRGYIHLNILVHTKHAEKFNRLLARVERGAHIELIEVTELNPAVAIRLQDKLQHGEFLVLVGDRIPVGNPGRTVAARFLGETAAFSQGPYLLASLLDCPVYTLFSYPRNGRYRIDLEPFAESIRIPHRQPQRDRELAAWAARYAACLEEHCRRVPLQWFNFFDFWDQPSAGRPEPTRLG
jgi:predicted LPLAT superfamily acyltransferase